MAKRLFIALPLSAPIRAEVNSLVHVLKRSATVVRWVRVNQLHITLRFLGDVDNHAEEKLLGALETLTATPSFRFNLAGVGAFPDRKRPRVIWTGIQTGADKVASLATNVEKSVVGAGLPAEDRPFSSHVTLGRLREPGNLDRLWETVDRTPFTSKEIDATEVRLIWSTLTPTGPVYRDVESFPLRG